jgi:hypothetical protein
MRSLLAEALGSAIGINATTPRGTMPRNPGRDAPAFPLRPQAQFPVRAEPPQPEASFTMELCPNDQKIVDRYLEYLNSRQFKPVLQKVAGTPYGRVILVLIAALSGVGAPIAVYQGWKVLTHRSRWRKSMIAVARSGRPIMTFPLMVNTALTRFPGTVAPGLVIGSFESNPEQTTEYWLNLAQKLTLLDPESVEAPEEKQALRWLQHQTYIESRRLRLPASLTGGHAVYAFHLKLVGDYFSSGLLDTPMIPCIAVPGAFGAIQQIPWWIAVDQPDPQ